MEETHVEIVREAYEELIATLRACVNNLWARGANVCDTSYPSKEEVAQALLPRERELFLRALAVLARFDFAEKVFGPQGFQRGKNA